MKVLWITNILLPPICEKLGLSIPPIGGWMYSSLQKLVKLRPDIKFAVATIGTCPAILTNEIDGVTYYVLPCKRRDRTKYNSSLEKYWLQIKREFNPDVVHIHGTEFPHGLAYIRACGSQGVVASLQGIISVYARYYLAGISNRDIRKNITIRDLILRQSIFKQQSNFDKRGKLETELIRNISHIIGRTDWDKAHVKTLNPDVEYHYCSETLRDEFYQHKWEYSKCEPCSIFVSQAGYPIKGLHILLKAFPKILERYPEATIYVGGSDIVATSWFKMTSYGMYIKNLIKDLGIETKVIFTGSLDEKQMCDRFLKSNVFVCPSSIENSPNSLGEAQLLGMPYVASYVGGIPEIVNNNPDVLYRFEEYEMLADRICNVLSQKELAATNNDVSRYDAENNGRTLIHIYNEIVATSK